MKIVKLIILVGAAAFAYHYYQNNIAFDHPIAGEWQSSQKKSMREWYKKGVTAKQEETLKKILGTMKYSIGKKVWVAEDGGETYRSSYTLAPAKNDCYEVTYKDGRKSNVCVKEGDLFVTPLPRNKGFGTEVFERTE